MTRTISEQHTELGDLPALAASFRRHLLAANKAPRTIEGYGEAVRLLAAFLGAQGMPTQVAALSREHVESFVADILTRSAPATASIRYRALQQFFKWAVDEGEIPVSPMAKMRPPVVPETPPPVVSDADLTRLLKACEGKDFLSRRDAALIRLLLDTGMRRLRDPATHSDHAGRSRRQRHRRRSRRLTTPLPGAERNLPAGHVDAALGTTRAVNALVWLAAIAHPAGDPPWSSPVVGDDVRGQVALRHRREGRGSCGNRRSTPRP